jgi:hypothetical protein
VQGLVALFLEVITLAIILLLIGLAALMVLVVTTRMIVALIVLMRIASSLVIVIASVTSMIVAPFATMLLVAQIAAACDGKMSCRLLFWLLKDAGRFIGSLTLLEKDNDPKQVCGHRFVCIPKLKLMCLGLHREDLFALLLCHGQLHRSTDAATVKVTEELYSTPHESMHWHMGGLLGGTKPADQLVANIWKPSNRLKVILDALLKFVFVWSASVGHCLAMTFIHSVRPTS